MSQHALFPQRTLTLRLSTHEAYQRKQRLWKLFCAWSQRIRRAFAPDTGGVSLYLHNWYACSNDPAKVKLAEWIETSTWARYRRLEAIMEAREVEREHAYHSKQMSEELIKVKGKWKSHTRPFDALWCPLCPSNVAKATGGAQ